MNRLKLRKDRVLPKKSKIPAYEYARKYGFLTSAVIYKIKAGILSGVQENGQWYVLSISQSDSAPPPRNKPLPIKETLRKWFAPSYDEVTLFVMGAAALLLFTIDPVMRTHFIVDFARSLDPRLLFLPVSFAAGLLLSIFHACIDRDKSNIEREAILLFAILLHVLTALEAFLNSSSGHARLHLFPLLNFLYAALLLALWRARIVDTSSLNEGQASRLQLGIALVVTYATLLVGHHVLQYHWTVTLSMTIALASTIGRGVDYVVFLFQKTKAV